MGNGEGSCIVAGDLSPLDDQYEGQGTSPSPIKTGQFSEGLDSACAPHVRMARVQKATGVSSFIDATDND